MLKKILIADDHYIVRVGTAIVIEKRIRNVSLDFAETYFEVKEKIKNDNFNLVILDIELPGSNYKRMIKELKANNKNLSILILTSHPESVALQYLKEGANGFLNKLCDEDTFIDAINSVLERKCYYSPAVINQFIDNSVKKDPIEILSKREFQIFNLLAKGYGNLEIATALHIHEATVGTHKKRIFEKLQISNIVELLEIYKLIH